jgi:hypothetical protein
VRRTRRQAASAAERRSVSAGTRAEDALALRVDRQLCKHVLS